MFFFSSIEFSFMWYFICYCVINKYKIKKWNQEKTERWANSCRDWVCFYQSAVIVLKTVSAQHNSKLSALFFFYFFNHPVAKHETILFADVCCSSLSGLHVLYIWVIIPNTVTWHENQSHAVFNLSWTETALEIIRSGTFRDFFWFFFFLFFVFWFLYFRLKYKYKDSLSKSKM